MHNKFVVLLQFIYNLFIYNNSNLFTIYFWYHLQATSQPWSGVSTDASSYDKYLTLTFYYLSYHLQETFQPWSVVSTCSGEWEISSSRSTAPACYWWCCLGFPSGWTGRQLPTGLAWVSLTFHLKMATISFDASKKDLYSDHNLRSFWTKLRCYLDILSWVTFWLNREATADRISLG